MEKPTYQGQQPSKEREWPPDGVESPGLALVFGMSFLKPIGGAGFKKRNWLFRYVEDIYILRIKWYYTHLYAYIFNYIQFVVNHNKDP